MDYFLITGMARSGTTLLEKMLASHPQMDTLSQPMPMLYRHLKAKFYDKIDYPETYYVLNDLFHEFKYSQDEFFSFLESYELSTQELKATFAEMEDWAGQWENIELGAINFKESAPCKTAGFYKELLQTILGSAPNVLGSKEVLVEEFVPYLLQNDVKVIMIIRDPRDVITSLNVGRGTDFAGAHRPTLFHLRNWRKSIAVANSMLGNQNFLAIRYEDLITQKYFTLSKVTGFLEVSKFDDDHFKNGIKTENGNTWKGNSSTNTFCKVNANNKEKFKQYLYEEMVKYIEYMCHPEMKLWGYDLLYRGSLDSYDPLNFKEPYDIQVEDLNEEMSSDRQEVELEIKRKQLLRQAVPSSDYVKAFFYSSRSYQVLKEEIGVWDAVC